jgi:hypothetical protein
MDFFTLKALTKVYSGNKSSVKHNILDLGNPGMVLSVLECTLSLKQDLLLFNLLLYVILFSFYPPVLPAVVCPDLPFSQAGVHIIKSNNINMEEYRCV